MLDGNDKEILLGFAKGFLVLLAFDMKDRAITIADIGDRLKVYATPVASGF